MRLRFLGTGASHGTPGSGRSCRSDSSLVLEETARVLLDVTHDFASRALAMLRRRFVALDQVAPVAVRSDEPFAPGGQVASLCPRATPAFDGMALRIGDGAP